MLFTYAADLIENCISSSAPGRAPFLDHTVLIAAPLLCSTGCSGTWEEADFKAYNYAALCPQPAGGYLHPLLKVH